MLIERSIYILVQASKVVSMWAYRQHLLLLSKQYVTKLKKKKKQLKCFELSVISVVDEGKKEHFDLLLITNGDKSHYTFISDFSRLIRAQKTAQKETVIFCKRYFTSFSNRPLKNKPYGQTALDQHKLICGTHKPILPDMPAAGTMLEFDGWGKTQCHLIFIYTDFKALLYVKTTENIPTDLLEKYDIPISPIIYRGNESRQDVAKRFVNEMTNIA
ncbi:Uncharacterized protein FWK35_00022830 [Aphis craccivora]|uniref:Uncharacterized protein n=1 Tax=Aphis craccivora TaxID=307492 RepID=A0A6G0Y5M6_APHCR|nr:Uncharacterized protein FWK35_00022830 [Aphis craccivora]